MAKNVFLEIMQFIDGGRLIMKSSMIVHIMEINRLPLYAQIWLALSHAPLSGPWSFNWEALPPEYQPQIPVTDSSFASRAAMGPMFGNIFAASILLLLILKWVRNKWSKVSINLPVVQTCR